MVQLPGSSGNRHCFAPSGTPTSANYDGVNVGGILSGAYYFNRYFGAQGEYGIHEWGSQSANGSNIGTHGNDDGFMTIAGGLIARYPLGNITPFAHGLVGTARVDGPYHQPFRWGPALTIGGGMDYETPFFNHHLAIRLFQADYRVHARRLRHRHLWWPRQYQRCAAQRRRGHPCRIDCASSTGDPGVLGQPRFSFPGDRSR